MGSYGFRETVHCAGVTSVNINALKASKGISSIKNINALKASEGIHSIRTIQTMCSLELMAAFRVPHCRLSSRTSRYITWGMEEELQQLAKPSASILDHDGGIPVNGTCQKESLQLQDDNCAYQLSLSTNKITEDSPSVSMVQHVIDAFVDKTFSFNIVKIAALTGIFSLQEYYQAWASTEIASSIQTVSWLGDLGDISTGCTSAFLLIFFSELGDKTFFIAALLASRKSNAAVFIGTFGALAAMTIISVFLGRTFHYVDGILPFRLGEIELPLDDLAAVGLLVYFGVSTLLEASSGDGSKANDEQEEAELAIAGFSGDGAGILAAANTIISTFALVFVAEWGDKSFFSTIALAAASSPLGVVVGAVAGHGVATLLVAFEVRAFLRCFTVFLVQIAVLGGSLLGTYVSEKVITYTGGILFLVFAAATLFEIFK